MIYIIDDSEAAKSASIKMATKGKPGAIIEMNKAEMLAIQRMVVIPFAANDEHPFFSLSIHNKATPQILVFDRSRVNTEELMPIVEGLREEGYKLAVLPVIPK